MTEVIVKEQLVQYITRLEKLEQEKADIAETINEVFAEAKGNGFDVKAMRQVLKLRKLDKATLAEQEEILDLYRQVFDL